MTQQQNLDRFRIGIFDKSLNIIIKPDTDYDVIDSNFVIYGDFSIDENGNYTKDKYGKYIKKELLRKLIDPKYEDCYSYDEWFSSKMEFCFGDFYWIRKYPENFTLLQSTGLKDKNGRLIYEGDILKIIPEDCKIFNRNNLSPVLCETFYKIEYEAFTGSLVAVNLANERHELSLNVNLANVSTIIGNIHTHPELLTAIETGEEIHL